MKYVIVMMGGAADRPSDALGGQTPLGAAEPPVLKRICEVGRVGQVRMTTDLTEPGADSASMALLGYDPEKCYPGRAPLVTAGMGIDQPNGAWAMNLSLMTAPDGTLDAYDDAVLPVAEAQAVMQDLAPRLGLLNTVIHPGPGAMHLLVDLDKDGHTQDSYRDWRTVVAAPPRVILDHPIREHLPVGDVAGERLQHLIAQSAVALQEHDINTARQEMGEPPITHLWPWGIGVRPALKPWPEQFGFSAVVLSPDPAVRGVGVVAEIDVVEPPSGDSLTGGLIRLSTDAIEAISLYDLVIVHTDAPQLAGYAGDAAGKADAIRAIDEHLLQPVSQALAARGEYRLMVTPLHATPAEDRCDDPMPVPFAITGYKMAGVVPRGVTEADAQACDLQVQFGYELMEFFLRSGVRG